MYVGLRVQCPLLLSDFHETFIIFSTDFRKKKFQIPNFMKIRPVGGELFHADGKTWRSWRSLSASLSNAPENLIWHKLRFHIFLTIFLLRESFCFSVFGLRFYNALNLFIDTLRCHNFGIRPDVFCGVWCACAGEQSEFYRRFCGAANMVEQRQKCSCAVFRAAGVFRQSRYQIGNKTFTGVTALFNIVWRVLCVSSLNYCRDQLKCDGTLAETWFCLSAKRTSPFKSAGGRQFSRLLAAEVCASAVVMLDTPCSEVVWRVLATHCIRMFPLHFPSRASPCAVTFQLESTSLLIINGRVHLNRPGGVSSVDCWQPRCAHQR